MFKHKGYISEKQNLFELVKLNFDTPVKSAKYREDSSC